MPTGKSHRYLTAVFLFTLSTAWAGDATEPTVLDSLEYKIEIARHERLLKVRKSEGVTLTPFASDGCSGGLSAGWELLSSALPEFVKRHGDRPPWESCCIAHDRAYHAGGPSDADARASFEARVRADEQLRQCVTETGEKRMPVLVTEYGLSPAQISRLYRNIAAAMHRAVRLGGAPCTGLPWRWGFGWPPCD